MHQSEKEAAAYRIFRRSSPSLRPSNFFVGRGKRSARLSGNVSPVASCRRWRWVHLATIRLGEHTPCAVSKRRAQEEFISSSRHIEYHSFLYELACAVLFISGLLNASHPRVQHELAEIKIRSQSERERGAFIDICIWWCASV